MTYTLLADGFEEIEVFEPLDIMRRAGIDARTVSITNQLFVKGAHGITTRADTTVYAVKPREMEMLILPGGGGHTALAVSKRVRAMIDFAVQNDIYIAAICAAPSILGRMDLLKGKRATCYPGFESLCVGAKMTEEQTVLDGKILTGKGPGAAAEFGFEIVKILKDSETAEKLRKEMQYK